MTSEQANAFSSAAQAFFTEENRQKMCTGLGLPPVGTWIDIITKLVSMFSTIMPMISPLLALFANCPPTPAPTPNVPPQPPKPIN